MSILPKIMVVAGGSGGHIMPALGFCQDAKLKALKIIFVTNQSKQALSLIPAEFNPVVLNIPRTIFGFVSLTIKALCLIAKENPDIVVGFGGFIGAPFIILAKVFFKKTIIHEQNVMLGRANRLLVCFADKIIISFAESRKFFRKNAKNIFLCRYPLRDSLKRVEKEKALSFFGLAPNFFTVLVVGGSQGARSVNEKFCEAIENNKNSSRMQIIHICGSRDFERVSDFYKQVPVEVRVFDFLPQMENAYSAADLVFSRSGAGSINEIMYFALPSILIPYPFAGSHQKENARVLAEGGAAFVLDDDKLAQSSINGFLDILIGDEARLKNMSAKAAYVYEMCSAMAMAEVVFQ